MCVTWVLELEGQKASTESCMTENDGVVVVFMSGGCLRWGIRISVCLYLFSDSGLGSCPLCCMIPTVVLNLVGVLREQTVSVHADTCRVRYLISLCLISLPS